MAGTIVLGLLGGLILFAVVRKLLLAQKATITLEIRNASLTGAAGEVLSGAVVIHSKKQLAIQSVMLTIEVELENSGMTQKSGVSKNSDLLNQELKIADALQLPAGVKHAVEFRFEMPDLMALYDARMAEYNAYMAQFADNPLVRLAQVGMSGAYLELEIKAQVVMDGVDSFAHHEVKIPLRR